MQLHICPAACLLIIKAYFPFNKLNWKSGTCNQRLLNNTPIPTHQCVFLLCLFYPSFPSTFLPFFSLSFLPFPSAPPLPPPLPLLSFSPPPPPTLPLHFSLFFSLLPPPSSFPFLFSPSSLLLSFTHLLSESKHGCTFMSAQQQSYHSVALNSRLPGKLNDIPIVPSPLRPFVL